MFFAYDKLHKNDFDFLNNNFDQKIKRLNINKLKLKEFRGNIVIITPYVDLILEKYLLTASNEISIYILITSNGTDKSSFNKLKNKKNIIIANSKSNSLNVAEYALALILDSFKKISLHDNFIKKNDWCKFGSKNFLPPKKLKKKNFAIYGFGNVGKKIFKMLRGFDVNIGTFQNSHLKKKLPKKLILFKNLKALSAWADCHINCLPLNKINRNFFDQFFFKNIKKSVFINISRGEVVDLNALISAYKKKKILHYATDVFNQYPKKNEETTEIKKLKKISCTLSPKRAGFLENELPHLQDILYNMKLILKFKKNIKNVIN